MSPGGSSAGSAAGSAAAVAAGIYFYVGNTPVGQAVVEHYARERFGTRGRVIEVTFEADDVWAALPRTGYREFVADPKMARSVITLYETVTPIRGRR